MDRVSIRGTSLVGRLKDSKVSLSDYPSRAYDFETTIGPDFYDTVLTMAANKAGKDVNTVSVHDLGFEIEYLAPIVTPWYLEILPYMIPIVLLMVMWWYIMRQQTGGGGRVMNFGKSRAAMVDPSKNKVTFADVAGADEEKEELREIVDFLKNPKHYLSLGARIPKGVLLVGPPGTGKPSLFENNGHTPPTRISRHRSLFRYHHLFRCLLCAYSFRLLDHLYPLAAAGSSLHQPHPVNITALSLH